MNPVAAKQVVLDNSLVPPEKILKIEKCNARIKFSKPQREETYQVTLDALKLFPCYPAFLITAEVLETYLDFATGKATPKKARKFKKVASPSRKLSPVIEKEPVVKPMRVKKAAKKYTTVQTTCVVNRDTPSESVPKKKTPTKVNRGKDMDILSDVVLLEDAQLKKTLKKSKLETHKLHANGLGDGVGSQPKVSDEQEDKTIGIDEGTCTKLGVLDVPKYLSESENES
ncbi:hypothetical protein Tco_1422759 [Tanacetum coccineum]